ncbi:hypothetical protein C0989_011328 [Termitomyces sp. Mn162]|nr:hypothetical protein C0989_011328 [Termitomyces sp. Mn162]
MSRVKLRVAIMATACVLNAGLAVASSIWLYRRIFHYPSSSNLRADSDEKDELDAGLSESSESQAEHGVTTETGSHSSQSSFSRDLIFDDTESYRNNFDTEVAISTLQPMIGFNAVNRHPVSYGNRISLRPHAHQVMNAATEEQETVDNNLPVDIGNEHRTSISAELSFVANHTIQMILVSNATIEESQATETVFQSLIKKGRAFTVFANYRDHPWTPDNLSVFLRGLASLWSHDRHGRCQKLSVNLPIKDLPSGATPGLFTVPSTLLLPQQLEAVVWRGHQNQFHLFFSQQLPPALRTLILRCKVSLHDCERLLYRGRDSLRKFDVHYIGHGAEDGLLDSSTGMLPLKTVMSRLESISLVANWDIFPLFEYFDYPTLRELHITNSKPRFKPKDSESEVKRYFTNVLRSKLTSTRLHCTMTQEEKDWLNRFRGHNDTGYSIKDDIENIHFDYFPILPDSF